MDYRVFMDGVLREASKIALRYFGKVSSVTKPEDNNQVLTEADIAVGKYIVAEIEKAFPEHNIIDEETGAIAKESPYTWTVDPIDGTANFVAGDVNYGIMIGLMQDGIPIAGGIIRPADSNIYLAAKSQGATRNGQKITVTPEEELANVLVAYGMDGLPNDRERNKMQCAVLADILPEIRNVRTTGCEAVDPMHVAEGIYGARVNLASKIWDVVPAHIICEEAGAIWTTANGEQCNYADAIKNLDRNYTSCVAPIALHKQLQTIIAGRLAG